MLVVVLRLGVEHSYEIDRDAERLAYQLGRFVRGPWASTGKKNPVAIFPVPGLFAGLSMLFIRSSGISLYVAEKALEVRKNAHTYLMRSSLTSPASLGVAVQSCEVRMVKELLLY